MIVYFIRGIELLQGKPCSFFMISGDVIVMAPGVWTGELFLRKSGKL